MGTKVTFDLGKKRVMIEGAEAELLKIIQAVKDLAPSFSEIRIVAQPSENPSGDTEIPLEGRPDSPGSGRRQTIRDFARSLQLANTYERIAALAYYAIKIEARPYFAVKDMEGWFGLCGFKKPQSMAVAFSDSKRRYGYVESRGRDQWTITTDGENKIMEKIEQKGGSV